MDSDLKPKEGNQGMNSILMAPEILVFSLATIIGSVIWFVRLEGRVNYESKINDKATSSMQISIDLSHKRIDETKARHEEMEIRIFNDISQIKVTLAEISGYLRKQGE